MTDTPVTPAASDNTATATDDFIRDILPAWLTQASLADIRRLRQRFAACNASREQLNVAKRHLTPPDSYAASLLGREILGRLGLTVSLNPLRWYEVRRRFVVPPGGGLPSDEIIHIRAPALQRLMQNFEDGVSYYVGSGLVEDDLQEALVTDRLAEIAQVCRSVDAGASYQALLSRVFNVATQGQLAADKRNGLAMAAQIAALKGQLLRNDVDVLRRLVDEPWDEQPTSRVRVRLLRVLDQPVDGALAVELRDTDGRLDGVVLYLPDVSAQPLQRYASWEALGATLAVSLKDDAFKARFSRLIALRGRPAFLSLLALRLSDTTPDLAPEGRVPGEEIFVSLAAQQVARIKDDARLLLVPTADADHAASDARIEALEGAGLGILNLAGLFVPVVGELLFGQMVVQTLGEVYEGAEDWSQGHQHEAMHHMLGVAETVVVATVVVGATAAVAHGFTRGRFVDELAPVELKSGARRLWSNDLAVYWVPREPEGLQLQDDGLYSDGQQHFWRHDGASHEVRQVDEQATWRLHHPERDEAYGPVLERSGERAWRLRGECPLEWEGEGYLLTRLWPGAERFDAQRIGQILRIAGIDENALRGLLVEGRALPVALRDTLERFAITQRVDGFFAQLGSSDAPGPDASWLAWCRNQLGAPAPDDARLRQVLLDEPALWRGRLLEHFSRRYLPNDALLPLVLRDFPGLPDAYALDVLTSANAAQRQRMLENSRLPLALAERAQSALHNARVTRMLEGVYWQDSQSSDTVELVFALLRRRAGWPQSLDVEVREGADTGPLLARLNPQGGEDRRVVMARRNGTYRVFDAEGRALDSPVASPQGLFEALVAALEPEQAQRLGWAGAGGGQRLRRDVQGWLPSTRAELLPLAGLCEIKPWFSPAQRLADGRVGYLLSGRGAGRNVAERTLRQRIRALYPGFDEQEVSTYLEAICSISGSPFVNLLNQEREYARFDSSLRRWEFELPRPARRSQRRYLCDELRRSWRLQSDAVIDSGAGQIGMLLNLSGIEAGSLPDLPPDTDFSHISELNLSSMDLGHLPANFLGCFRRLRRLVINNNRLDTLPAGLAALTDLRELRLRRNNIAMNAPSGVMLSNLRELRLLDLSNNPLGLISLHFRQLSPLTELNLRRCQLRTVPSGLEWCGFLEVADLRDNLLASLPQAILDAPLALRRTLRLDGNPLPEGIRRSLSLTGPATSPAISPGIPTREEWVRTQWLADLEVPEQLRRGALWDQLRAEQGSGELFDLFDQLTGTSDFERAQADLRRRVGVMLNALAADSALREEVFNLAASPRTCVDSVASCFSTLEVRVLMTQELQRYALAEGQSARLNLARRLFRLDRVEQFAREDITARLSAGQSVDEIEVSLAYRTGLAQRLELPGQPRTLQFAVLSGVTEASLDQAAEAVRLAEASEALAVYVGERDFWREHLRRENAQRFEGVEQLFWKRLEALSAQQESLAEGIYLQRINQLSDERQAALDALFLTLTQQALAAQSAGVR